MNNFTRNTKKENNNNFFQFLFKIQSRIFKKKKTGFTIIESLIAITILMISVTAPLTLSYDALMVAYLAEDQIIASYLAQDAIEYIRNKRDFNKLAGTTYMLDNIFGNCQVANTVGLGFIGIDDPGTIIERGCHLDTFSSVSGTTHSVYTGEKLYYHSLGGEYNYTAHGGIATKFSRQVRIGYINVNLTEAIVEVIIR